MLDRLYQNNKKKIIFIFIFIVALGILLVSLMGKKEGFDVDKIQINLTEGIRNILNEQIVWKEENGKLVGIVTVEKFGYLVTYYLSSKEINTTTLFDLKKSQNIINQVPCLNIVHLLTKSDVKKIYETIYSKQQHDKPIKVRENLFIEYYQEKKETSILTGCKIYYTN